MNNNADETADEETPTSNVGGTGQHQGRGHRHSKSRKWSLTPSGKSMCISEGHGGAGDLLACGPASAHCIHSKS